jgi:hypothetical protein
MSCWRSMKNMVARVRCKSLKRMKGQLAVLASYGGPNQKPRPLGGDGLLVRTKVNPASLIPAVREAVWAVDKDQPLDDFKTIRPRNFGFDWSATFQRCLGGWVCRFGVSPGLTDADPWVRMKATNILRTLDPEAAAKAGEVNGWRVWASQWCVDFFDPAELPYESINTSALTGRLAGATG